MLTGSRTPPKLLPPETAALPEARLQGARGPTTSGGNVRPSGQGTYVAVVSLVRGPACQSVPAHEGDGSVKELMGTHGAEKFTAG